MISFAIAFVNTLRYGGGMDAKLNRDRWLTAGLQSLAEQGPEGLRIMPIAEQLGVTKGSFYWHFKDLDAYRSALLDEWEQRFTLEAIQYLEKEQRDPHEKLRMWITGAAYSDFRLDRAIRFWSLNHAAAKKARSRVDAERINYLSKLLRDVGWSKDEAATLGQWAYCAWIGYATIDQSISEKQIKLIISVLTPAR